MKRVLIIRLTKMLVVFYFFDGHNKTVQIEQTRREVSITTTL